MSILIYCLIGVGIVALIGFCIWFFARTPDNLEGYYSGPVIGLSIFIGLILIGVLLFLIL